MIKWGELGKYLPEDLLNKTNVEEFITQEIVDEFNKVLMSKNPNHKKGDFREWDYAEFSTENGGYFSSDSILKPLFATTDMDELFTEISYKLKGKLYTIKGINYKSHAAIKLLTENNMLYYAHEDGAIYYAYEGDKFTISGVKLPQITADRK